MPPFASIPDSLIIAQQTKLYKRAFGVEKIFDDTDVSYVMEKATDGVFTPEGLAALNNGKQAHKANRGSKYNNLVAEALYGGRGIASAPNEGIRTIAPRWFAFCERSA